LKIKLNTAALGQTKWYQYLIRFLFGGAVTALTGLIAKRFGPGIGGLFLAFPAIFPATATLIEKHEKEKKERAGKNGVLRARAAAGTDAAGAALGTIGLAAFAIIVWRWLPNAAIGIVLFAATLVWVLVSISAWLVRDTLWRRARAKFSGRQAHRQDRAWLPASVKGEPSAARRRRSNG
jgi:Protein of unknown function (DUF3147)